MENLRETFNDIENTKFSGALEVIELPSGILDAVYKNNLGKLFLNHANIISHKQQEFFKNTDSTINSFEESDIELTRDAAVLDYLDEREITPTIDTHPT